MSKYPKLAYTPIKEIVFTISFVEEVTSEALAGFCSIDKISSAFIRHEGFQAKIEARKNQEPVTNVIKDGYVLRSEDLNQIIEVKKGLFSLHKIKEYESFESLYEKVQEYWLDLLKFTGGLTIKNISLRYLNFIVMDEGETIEKLINVKIEHPYGFDILNKFIHLTFNGSDPNLKINIISSIGKDQNRNGVILDNILNWKIDSDKKQEEVISCFHEMREIKNNIFFKTLTEYTLNKYNGNK